jgi:hypothetical protein
MPEINLIQTISVGFDTSQTNVSIPITLSFRPDELRVKHVVLNVDNADDNVYQLWSNMIADGILAIFPGNVCSPFMNNRFTLSNFPMQRNWQFQIQTIPSTGSGTGIATTFAGKIGVMLEFIQYKQLPEPKFISLDKKH